MAAGDLDNDGDLDLVINCFNAPALVYRNEAGQPRVGVRLKGKAPNTQGIGAKIKVTGGPVVQTQEVIAGGRYVSGDDPMRVFAAGASTNLTIEVTWRTRAKRVSSPLNRTSFTKSTKQRPGTRPPPRKNLSRRRFSGM